MLKNQKGITLVALVVTIVVLIILATISISVAIQGGLIEKTEKAADLYANVDKKFNEQEQNFVKYTDKFFENFEASQTR